MKDKKADNRYLVVPNYVIQKSCADTPYVLPVFLLLGVKADYSENNVVDTNIALIRETFINSSRDWEQNREIKEVLKLLGRHDFGPLIEYRYKMDDVKPETRLQCFFISGQMHYNDGYTIIDFKEFLYLSDWAYAKENERTSKDKLINSLLLINLYCYMKMKIQQFENLTKYTRKKGASDFYCMNESVNTIAEYFNKGNRTISRYLGILEDLGFIRKITLQEQVSFGKSHNPDKKIGWALNDKWEEYY